VAFSADGRHLVSASYGDDTIYLWDAERLQAIRRFRQHSKRPGGVALSPDGRLLLHRGAQGLNKGELILVLSDATTGEGLETQALTAGVASVTFSPDGKRGAVGLDDGSAAIFELDHLDQPRRWQWLRGGHAKNVATVAFAPDGKSLFTGSEDGTARRWGLRGKRLALYEGHRDIVRDIAVGGSVLATGSDDGVLMLWDPQNAAKPFRTLKAPWGIDDVDVRGDGAQVLAAGGLGAIRIWSVADGTIVHDAPAAEGSSLWRTAAAFAPDGRSVAVGGIDCLQVIDLESGTRRASLPPWASPILDAGLSHDAHWFLVRTASGAVHVWSTTSGRFVRRIEAQGPPGSMAVSPTRAAALVGAAGGEAHLYDLPTGRLLQRLPGHQGALAASVFLPDGRRAATADEGGVLRIFDLETGAELHRWSGHEGRVVCLSTASEGDRLVSCGVDKTTRVWGVGKAKPRELCRIDHTSVPRSAALTPDGRKVFAYPESAFVQDDGQAIDATVLLYDFRPRPLRSYPGAKNEPDEDHGALVCTLSVSRDGKRLLTASEDGSARFWNVKTGRSERRIRGHDDVLGAGRFSMDGRYILTQADRVLRLWDARTTEELCTLVVGEDRWIVATPGGTFDGSDLGRIKGVHAVVGADVLDLDQIRDRYYEPGLLARVISGRKAAVRTAPVLPPPSIRAEAPTAADPTLRVRVENDGGGIGPISVRVNGKRIVEDARGHTVTENAAHEDVEVDLADDPRVLPGARNVLEVRARNGNQTARGRLVTEFQAAGTPREPDVWAIVCGVADYAGSKIDLAYAAEDAKAFAFALDLGARALFEHVHVEVLTSPTPEGGKAATRANLKAAFAAARRAKSEDVLVLYLAGHGVIEPTSGAYHFLLADAEDTDLAGMSAEERERVAVSTRELSTWIENIPAVRRQVLFLDTCASGGVRDDLRFAGQARLADRLHDDTGVFLLAGSAADRVSYESPAYGHGVLTYALLHGLQCGCHQEGFRVDVAQLIAFAAGKASAFARDVGVLQDPVTILGDEPFDIGRLTLEDRKRIPLRPARPLVVRASFEEKDAPVDSLELSPKVDAAVSELASNDTGGAAPLRFVPTATMPWAYRISGRYVVTGSTARLTVYVYHLPLDRGPVLVDTFEVEGPVDSAEAGRALAKRIVDRARAVIVDHPR
jgi:WD40 repeat protein